MPDRVPVEVTNLDRYGSPALPAKYCLVCHADLTELLHELDELEPGEDYGFWGRDGGSSVIPMDSDALPY